MIYQIVLQHPNTMNQIKQFTRLPSYRKFPCRSVPSPRFLINVFLSLLLLLPCFCLFFVIGTLLGRRRIEPDESAARTVSLYRPARSIPPPPHPSLYTQFYIHGASGRDSASDSLRICITARGGEREARE